MNESAPLLLVNFKLPINHSISFTIRVFHDEGTVETVALDFTEKDLRFVESELGERRDELIDAVKDFHARRIAEAVSRRQSMARLAIPRPCPKGPRRGTRGWRPGTPPGARASIRAMEPPPACSPGCAPPAASLPAAGAIRPARGR